MKNYFLKYNDFLNESLSSARKKFVDSGLIDSEEFQELSGIDPTPTKKYLEKICAWYTEDHPIDDIEEYIKKFHSLLSKVIDKNINNYTFEAFKVYLDSLESKTAKKKEITKGIEVVYETEEIQITQPKTYEQSCILGAGTTWCTASKDTSDHWNDYTNNERITFYYIWRKKSSDTKYYKLAVCVDINDDIKDVFDAEDKKIPIWRFKDIVEENEIPTDIFKTRFAEDKENYIGQKGFETHLKNKGFFRAYKFLEDNPELRTIDNLKLFVSNGNYASLGHIAQFQEYHTEEAKKIVLGATSDNLHILADIMRQCEYYRTNEIFRIILGLGDPKYCYSVMRVLDFCVQVAHKNGFSFEEAIKDMFGIEEYNTPENYYSVIHIVEQYYGSVKSQEYFERFFINNDKYITRDTMDYIWRCIQQVESLRTIENFTSIVKSPHTTLNDIKKLMYDFRKEFNTVECAEIVLKYRKISKVQMKELKNDTILWFQHL